MRFLRRFRARPWFRIGQGEVSHIDGKKEYNGNLRLTIGHGKEFTTIVIDSDNVLQMIDWLNRVYPRSNNVIQLASPLPIRDSSGRTE